MIKQEVIELLKKRRNLRKQKKYQEADIIRKQIFNIYPELKISDERDGTIFIHGWVNKYLIIEWIK